MRYSLWPFLPHPYLSPFFLAPSSFHFCYASVEFLCIFSRASTFFTRSSCASIFFSLTRLFIISISRLFFLSCWPLHDNFLLFEKHIYIYSILWPDKKKWRVRQQVNGATPHGRDHARCHWGRKSQLRNHRSFLIGWFIRADLHKLLGGTSERPLKLGAAFTWKFVHQVLED